MHNIHPLIYTCCHINQSFSKRVMYIQGVSDLFRICVFFPLTTLVPHRYAADDTIHLLLMVVMSEGYIITLTIGEGYCIFFLIVVSDIAKTKSSKNTKHEPCSTLIDPFPCVFSYQPLDKVDSFQ